MGIGLGSVVLVTLAAFLMLYSDDHHTKHVEIDQTKYVATVVSTEVVDPGLALPEKDRKYLWDVEHMGTVLRKYGFKPLANALTEANPLAIEVLLEPNFTALIPQQADTVYADFGIGRASRVETSGHPHDVIAGQQFVRWLLSHRALFLQAPKVKISLMKLGPMVRDNFDGVWVGSCRIRMWGETSPGSPAEVVFYLEMGLDIPTEERLKRGGWIRSCTIRKMKMAQSEHYLMDNDAGKWGLDTKSLHDNWDYGPDRTNPNPGGVYLCDFNQDGFVDLLVNDIALIRGYALYQGQPGGKLVDVTLEVGLPPLSPPSLVAFVDLDGDGWEDLILGPGLVFRNLQGKRFENVSSRSNLSALGDLRKTQGFSGVAIADFDRDSRMDLYIFRASSRPKEGSWVGGKMGEDYENQLLRNVGNWNFEDVTSRTRTDGGKRSTFSAVWFDANNDSWPDLYVIHEFGNGVLLVNRTGGSFEDHILMDGPADFGSMGVTSGDLDNDGLIDLYVASMYSKSGNRVMANLRPDAYPELVMQELRGMVAGSQLYHNAGDLKFEPVGSKYGVRGVGWAYGPAMVDLDNDGWLDIYATAGFVSRFRDKPDG